MKNKDVTEGFVIPPKKYFNRITKDEFNSLKPKSHTTPLMCFDDEFQGFINVLNDMGAVGVINHNPTKERIKEVKRIIKRNKNRYDKRSL